MRTQSGVRHRSVVDVVLVDDDAELAAAIAACLVARHRMAVRTYATTREAWDAIRAQRPHVVVCDLWLEGEIGTELATALRDHAELATLPIVAISGRVDPEWSVVRPFDAYLRKPVDPDELGDLVRALHEGATGARDRRSR